MRGELEPVARLARAILPYEGSAALSLLNRQSKLGNCAKHVCTNRSRIVYSTRRAASRIACSAPCLILKWSPTSDLRRPSMLTKQLHRCLCLRGVCFGAGPANRTLHLVLTKDLPRRLGLTGEKRYPVTYSATPIIVSRDGGGRSHLVAVNLMHGTTQQARHDNSRTKWSPRSESNTPANLRRVGADSVSEERELASTERVERPKATFVASPLCPRAWREAIGAP